MNRDVARGGTWVNAPRHGVKKSLAPELQTDDCFATGVTRQTLLILISTLIFRKFSGGYAPRPPYRSYASAPCSWPFRSLHRCVAPYKNAGYAPENEW